MNPIRAVILDFGNVISMPQDETKLVAMERLAGLERAAFQRGYQSVRHEYDRGTLDSEGFWRSVLETGGAGRPAGFDGEEVRRLTELDIQSWTVIRTGMIEWVRTLKASGLRTGILSNMPFDHETYITSHFEWIGLFDETVFSCDLGMIKPEAGIYSACLERLGIAPGEALFVDDLPANVEAARAAGMRAIEFRDINGLVRELKDFPELPLPPLR